MSTDYQQERQRSYRLILGLERYGFRPVEAVIAVLVGVVAASYIIETYLDHPAWDDVAYHFVVPCFSNTESILLATGILGATVMPHVIFLHSALVQNRIVTRDPKQLKRLYRFEMLDVAVAMGMAGLINASMLIMAASTFFQVGLDPTRTLVISQVVLSFGLPFAIIPLVMFTRRHDVMGVLVNKPVTTMMASVAAVLIVALNIFLLFQLIFGS